MGHCGWTPANNSTRNLDLFTGSRLAANATRCPARVFCGDKVAKKPKKAKKPKRDAPLPQAEQRSLLAPRRITGPNFRKELAFVRTLAELRSTVPKVAPRTGFRKKTLDPEEAAVQAAAHAEEDAAEAEAFAKRMAKYTALRSLYRTAELASATAPLLLVDGYNVIFASRRLARLAALRSLDSARERLVNEVGDFAVDKGMRSVVVFDAMGNPEGAFRPLPRRTDRGGVDVVYCATCEADSFLVEEARKQRAGGAARVLIATNDVDVQEDTDVSAEIAYVPALMLLAEMRLAARQAAKRERALHWAWRAGNVGQLERTLRQRSPGVASALAHTRDALWQAQRARREALGLYAGSRAPRAHLSSGSKPASGGGASLPGCADTGPSDRPGTTDAAGLPAGHANGFSVARSAEARDVSSSPVREGSAALVSSRSRGPDGGFAADRTGACAASGRAEAGAAEAALPVDAAGSGAGDMPECRWGAEGGAEPAGGPGLVLSGVSRRVVPARTNTTQANLVSGSSASDELMM